MSNLNMPSTTYAALTARFKRPGRAVRTLCYATTVMHSTVDPSVFVISQHGNPIAEVGPLDLYVTNAGWGSSTTRARLNAILAAYGLPFYVAQRQGAQVLFQRIPVLVDGIGEHVELTREFQSLTADLIARVYSVNGSAPVGY